MTVTPLGSFVCDTPIYMYVGTGVTLHDVTRCPWCDTPSYPGRLCSKSVLVIIQTCATMTQ